MKKTILTLSVVLALAGWSLAESRTWTQASTGKTLSGELTEIRGDKARIKMEGNKVLDLPIAMLSEADKTFIKNWQTSKETRVDSDKPALPAKGPVEVELGNIHLCCNGCKNAATGSIGLTGVTLEVEGPVVIKAINANLARAAYAALIKNGFYGETKFDMGASMPAYPTEKVTTLKVEGYHNCCNSCKSDIEGALTSVAGVKTVDVQKTAATIEGEFSPAEVMASLQKAGVSAQIGSGS